jgi:hypothetical protein
MMLQEKYDLVDELLNILEKLIAIYTKLKVLNNDKQRVLATDNLKDLQTIFQKEQEMASIIVTLEEQRITLQNAINSSHTSLKQLIELLDEPRKGRAISLSQELRRLVYSLRGIQDTNSIIIHHLFNFLKHERNILYQVSTVPDYGDNSNFFKNKSMINKII